MKVMIQGARNNHKILVQPTFLRKIFKDIIIHLKICSAKCRNPICCIVCLPDKCIKFELQQKITLLDWLQYDFLLILFSLIPPNFRIWTLITGGLIESSIVYVSTLYLTFNLSVVRTDITGGAGGQICCHSLNMHVFSACYN